MSFTLFALSITLALPSVASAQALFQEESGALPNQGCNGNGCWTNYVRLTDIDNDDDLDILFPNAAGFGNTQGQSQPFVIYRNDGNFSFTNVSAEAVGNFTGWLRQVAVADISGDGFVDIYAPSAWGADDKFFINDGTGKFVDEAAARLPNVKSRAGATRFGDVDNDGDLDLLVGDDYSGNSGQIAHLYLNDGTGKFTEAPWALPTMMSGDQPIDFDLFDMDGDYDLDLFINQHFGTKGQLWQNDGTGKFVDVTANIPSQDGQSKFRYGPVACDVDGDGDLDIWQDNAIPPGGAEQLLINDGKGKFTDETVARVSGNSANADDNGLACIDADGDGDLDAVIFNLGTAERLLINDGNGNFTFKAGAFPNSNDSTLWIEFGDLNGDGRLDFASAQGEGSSLDKVFSATNSLPVDTVAPKIRGVESIPNPAADATAVVRYAVSDNATTDEGPRLQKAFVKILAPAASEVPAMFMGGDLFRAVLPGQPLGTEVQYQACAVDRQGNEGCSMTLSYVVGDEAPGTRGGAGDPGTGGAGRNQHRRHGRKHQHWRHGREHKHRRHQPGHGRRQHRGAPGAPGGQGWRHARRLDGDGGCGARCRVRIPGQALALAIAGRSRQLTRRARTSADLDACRCGATARSERRHMSFPAPTLASKTPPRSRRATRSLAPGAIRQIRMRVGEGEEGCLARRGGYYWTLVTHRETLFEEQGNQLHQDVRPLCTHKGATEARP
ncbi:MAG: VCBS repeat-containing protein [Polyangiaceae bacterium]